MGLGASGWVGVNSEYPSHREVYFWTVSGDTSSPSTSISVPRYREPGRGGGREIRTVTVYDGKDREGSSRTTPVLLHDYSLLYRARVFYFLFIPYD